MTTTVLFAVGICSFGVQQFVEIVWDPLSTYFLRCWLSSRGSTTVPPTLFGFTETELRTNSNNAFASAVGILLSSLVSQLRILASFGVVGTGQNHRLLDIVISGLVIGAGTNGTNSLLKLAQYVKQRVGPLGGASSPALAPPQQVTEQPGLHPLVLSSQQPVSNVGSTLPSLNVPYQCQQCTNWCWAAIGSMVAQSVGQGESQCEVATRVLANVVNLDCCANQVSPGGCNVDDPSPCNREARLEDALGEFLSGSQANSIDVETIDQTINIFRSPFGCHITLSNPPGSHFVLVIGFELNTSNPEDSLLTVNDPDPVHGQWVDRLSNLRSYRGNGRWDFTYFTRVQL